MPLVWLFNWLMIGTMLVLVFNWSPFAAGLSALGVLVVLTLLAASRLSERIVGWFLGARRPSRQELGVIDPALGLLKGKIGASYQPVVVVLDRPLPQALALGRSTVVVTAGLLAFCSGGELAGVLAHEAGHHVEGHAVSRLILRVLGLSGGLAGACGWAALYLGLALGRTARKNSVWECAYVGFSLLVRFVRLIQVAEKALCAALSRREEYVADAFAARLGFGAALGAYLTRLAFWDQVEPNVGWQRLCLTHPPYHRRLERLRDLS